MANALSFADPRLQKPAGAVGTMPAPPPVAPPQVANALKPQASFASAPQQPQHRMIGAAVDGFQRGFDPKGWQAGQDKAKTDKAESLKKQITTLQNVRALPLEQRMQVLPQLAQSMGKQIPPELMQDAAIDQHLALLMGEAGMAPNVPDPMSAYEAAQIRLKEEEAGQPRHQFLQGQDGSLAVGNLTDGTIQELRPGQPKPDPANYDMVTTADGVIAVNKRNPNDKIRIGAAPPRASGGAGGQPPSGYRWKADGTLERIPGGPADKPSAPAYDAPTARKYLNQAQTLDSLDGAINQYMALIEKHGPQIQTSGLEGDNKIAAQLDAARTAIDIQTKELFNLGVLNGPDLDIIRGAIPDVTGFEAWGKTGDSVSASMNVLRDYITRGRNQIPPEIIARARPNGAPGGQPQGGGPLIDPLAVTGQAMGQSIQDAIRQALTRDDGQNDDESFIDSLFPADDGDTGEIPEGITPEEWDAMPPEDRALFQ